MDRQTQTRLSPLSKHLPLVATVVKQATKQETGLQTCHGPWMIALPTPRLWKRPGADLQGEQNKKIDVFDLQDDGRCEADEGGFGGLEHSDDGERGDTCLQHG